MVHDVCGNQPRSYSAIHAQRYQLRPSIPDTGMPYSTTMHITTSLRASYGMSGTDVSYGGGTREELSYPMSGTGIGCPMPCPGHRLSYAMSGSDIRGPKTSVPTPQVSYAKSSRLSYAMSGSDIGCHMHIEPGFFMACPVLTYAALCDVRY
eukprot:2845468-Rhodomonas_salina.2